jgi:site-specific DNA-methyltransferase (cytosine-N4-specific)
MPSSDPNAGSRQGVSHCEADNPTPREVYRTRAGMMWQGLAESFLGSELAQKYRGQVQLILTSPPFPLNRKKRYGNLQGEAYTEWLAGFAPLFRSLLKPNGSVVLEMGNAWGPGQPVMSTLALRSLLSFLERGPFHLCQQFVYENPARLPSPVQWVNIERARVKDAFTHLWWMSPATRPKADNRRVLQGYSESMLRLLAGKRQSAGARPSGHSIGKASFARDNGGAIPSNVLRAPNTSTSDEYQRYCREHGLPRHPARMHAGVVEFFVRFLTTPRDIVLDPFAGSNTTGAVAEQLGRRWLAVEARSDYVAGSVGRFSAAQLAATCGRSGCRQPPAHGRSRPRRR